MLIWVTAGVSLISLPQLKKPWPRVTLGSRMWYETSASLQWLMNLYQLHVTFKKAHCYPCKALVH